MQDDRQNCDWVSSSLELEDAAGDVVSKTSDDECLLESVNIILLRMGPAIKTSVILCHAEKTTLVGDCISEFL